MQESRSTCKIYSRNRINLFKNNQNRSFKKSSKIRYLIIIMTVIFFIIIIISKSIDPIFETICSDKAVAIATKISNEESTKAMQGYTYKDMFNIERDEERKYTNDKCKYFYNR